LLAATVAAFALFRSPIVHADTLFQAWATDDIISLDPAEIFEFIASEIAGNAYEGLIGYDPMDVSKIYGKVAESWEVAPDDLSITFKIKPGWHLCVRKSDHGQRRGVFADPCGQAGQGLCADAGAVLPDRDCGLCRRQETGDGA
jgi:hypothetical protein